MVSRGEAPGRSGIYADDTGLYSTGPSISAMEETVKRDLYKLCCWLLANNYLIANNSA